VINIYSIHDARSEKHHLAYRSANTICKDTKESKS